MMRGAIAVLMLIVPACTTTTADSPAQAPVAAQPGAVPQALGGLTVSIDGTPTALATGDYVVAILSATCEHCLAAVPEINVLDGAMPEPRVIGLVGGNEEEYAKFLAQSGAAFATARISHKQMFDLITQPPPQFVLLREGAVLQAWAGHPPAVAAVEALLGR